MKPDRPQNTSDEHGEGEQGRRQCCLEQYPKPVTRIHIHAEHCQDFAIAPISPGPENHILHALHIAGLVIQLFVGRILPLIFHPAAAFGLNQLLDFPAITSSAGPIFLVYPVLAHQFRLGRMRQPGHIPIIDEQVQIALTEFAMRVAGLLQEFFPSVLPIILHRLLNHLIGVLGTGAIIETRLRVNEWGCGGNPFTPAVDIGTFSDGIPAAKNAMKTGGGLVVNLAGRGTIRGICRLAIHEEMNFLIRPLSHQIDEPTLW